MVPLTETALTSYDASDFVGPTTLLVAASRLDNMAIKGSSTAATDSVTYSGVTGLTAATGKGSLTGVETVVLRTATSSSVIDASGLSGTTKIAVENDQNLSITNLAAGVTVQLGESATAGLEDYTGSLTLALADATGSADSITVSTIASGTNDDVDANIITTGIETLNIAISAGAGVSANSGDVQLGVASSNASTLSLSGGKTTEDLDMTKGGTVTLNAATTTVNSTYAGTLVVTAEANQPTTMTVAGTSAATLTGSTGADTFTIGSTTATHTIDGGVGVDTLNITSSGTTAMTSMEGIEVYNITVAAGAASVMTAAASKFFNDTMVQSIVVSGGSATSTFDSGADGVDTSGTATLFDFSGFEGRVNDLLFDTDALTVTKVIKGAKSATDVLTADFDNNQVMKVSDFETLALSFGGDVNLDMSSVTGATTVTVSSDTSARVATLSQLASTVALKVTADDDLDGITLVASDKSATDNSVALEITSADAGEDLLVDMEGIETLTITNKAADVDVNLTNFDMDTATKTNSLVIKGAVNTDIITLSADTTVINASAMTAGGVDIEGRTATTAITFTGSAAAEDSVIMINNNDVLDGGTKAGVSDTLNIQGAGVIGGFVVDLSSTTDQVATYKGAANTAAQVGFENVNLSGVTGSFAADVTAAASGSHITGTANADSITLGAGADTIRLIATGLTTMDTVTGLGSTDKFELDSATFTVGDFGTGTAVNAGANDDVVVSTTALADDAAIITAIRTSTDTTPTIFVFENVANANVVEIWFDADPNVDGGR